MTKSLIVLLSIVFGLSVAQLANAKQTSQQQQTQQQTQQINAGVSDQTKGYSKAH